MHPLDKTVHKSSRKVPAKPFNKKGTISKFFAKGRDKTMEHPNPVKRPKKTAQESLQLYMESYPDITKAVKDKREECKEAKENNKKFEKLPGIYVESKTNCWYSLRDDGRIMPLDGCNFFHPYLQRIVKCVHSRKFLELDGSVIEDKSSQDADDEKLSEINYNNHLVTIEGDCGSEQDCDGVIIED